MIRKTLTLAPLLLAASISHAAETVKVYKLVELIAPTPRRIFRKKPALRHVDVSTATKTRDASC